MFRFNQEDIDRFTDKIVMTPGPLETECWVWTGAKSRGQGNLQWYGSFRIGRIVVRAHKFAYVAIGRRVWTKGLHLDHHCENSLCVRPCHLEAVTREVNQERKYRREYDYKH